jgi:hypothetical protein
LNLKDQDVNTLRLIRLGHQCEVYYNDRRILYAPALEVASPAVNVKSLGMKLTIESIEVVELLPPR